MERSIIKNFLMVLFSYFILAPSAYGQISVDKSSGCVPLVVSFEMKRQDFDSIKWFTNNGHASDAESPTFIFEENGNWDVTAILTRSNGKKDTILYEDMISVAAKPSADFEVASTSFCSGQAVKFINKSTDADHYKWSFGDGNQSSDLNPVYQYEEAGVYTVTLTAMSDANCEDMVVKESLIEINEVKEAEIKTDRLIQCLSDDMPLDFSLSGDINQAKWDFGDGTTQDGLNVNHLYTAVGEYEVKVEYVDVNGCTANIQLDSVVKVEEINAPRIKVSETLVCLGQEVTLTAAHKDSQGFQWQVDGATYEGKTVKLPLNQPGKVAVKLTYTNQSGCSVEVYEENVINVKEVAQPQLDIATFSGCEPFSFTANNNTKGAVAFAWKIDDKIIEGAKLDYTFEESGVYKVVAVTTYESGCKIETELENKVNVFKSESNVKVDSWYGCAPFNTELALLNVGASDVKWTINGEELSGETINFGFEQPGVYYPSVSYVNNEGCQIQYDFESPITVLSTNIALDEPEVIESCTYTKVHFSGDMGYDFWEWDFGDGNTSNKQNPVHSYSESGKYEVSLTTNNRNGCETTIERYNIINIPNLDVKTNFNVSKGDECGFFRVAVEAELEDWQTAKWYYNESLVGTESNLKVTFISLGDVSLTLVVGSEGECTKSKAIMIPNPWEGCENPEIEEEAEETEGDSPIGKFQFSSCNVPYSIDLINPIPNAEKFQWRYDNGSVHSKKSFTETFTEAGEHTIGYWAKVEDDSVVFIEDYITVTIQASEIDFAYEVKKVCEGFEITLIPENPESENYRWKLNNESVELSADRTFFIEKAGLYSVSLSSNDQKSCATTKIKNLFVGNRENQFSYPKSLCLGEGLTVEHSLKGFDQIVWDMGNGEIISDFDSQYFYPSSGVFSVTALATDVDGCEYEFVLPKEIIIKNPVAEFTANKTNGCGETTVAFRNRSEGAVEWFWDFGNGQTSTEENPKVKFSPGTYTVTLTATDGKCKDVISQSDYIIIQELSSDFSYTYDQTCLPLSVAFKDESVNASKWHWDFGDGNSSTEQNPMHTFYELPEKPVKLTIENETGCKVSSKHLMNFIFSATFEAKETGICLGKEIEFSAFSDDAVNWNWNFGDGTSSSKRNPVHRYEAQGIYDVQLIAENGSGCADTVLMKQYIEVSPHKADFQLSESIESNCVPVQVSFQDLSEGAVSYFWDFGDGKTSRVASPVHLYNTVGEFDVSLVITNKLGCVDTLRKEQLVRVSGPKTEFEIDDKIVCLPNTANFRDVSDSAVKWKWIFGDGNTSTKQNPKHLYTIPGTYKVTLIAENADGCEQTFSMDGIKVLPTPEVDFQMGISGECYPVEVKLTNKSSNLLNPSYLWEFGDGQISKAKDPVILMKQTGEFSVKLTVQNDNGCPVSYTHKSQVLVRDTVQHHEANLNQILVENNEVHFELEPFNFNNISHYNVYRDGSGGFDLLKTIKIELGQNQRVMYDDKNCTPQNISHQYIFQAVSFCEDTVPKDQLTIYNTIHLEREQATAGKRLVNWNQSKGFRIDNQRVFRKPKGEGQWQEIAVVNVDALNFRDEEDLCPGTYQYRVGVFEQNTLRSISNYVEFEVSDQIYLDQVAEIQNTTVMETGEVFTEWSIPEEGKGRITAFEIYRSENGGEFVYHDSVEPHEQFYIDENSDTENNTYNYQVKVVNDCSIDTEISDESNTMLLQKNVQFRKYELKWNAFEGWEEGVKKYVIQRLNDKGEWETVEEVEGGKLQTIIRDTQD